jgi:hypothetical protein
MAGQHQDDHAGGQHLPDPARALQLEAHAVRQCADRRAQHQLSARQADGRMQRDQWGRLYPRPARGLRGLGQAGNKGWGYSDVLPAFTRSRITPGPDKPWHGKGGELDVQQPRSFNPITHAIIEAAQAGHARNEDFAGERSRPVSGPMTSTSGAARGCRARGPFFIRCSNAPI